MKQNSNNKRERKKNKREEQKNRPTVKSAYFIFQVRLVIPLFLLNGTGPAVLPYLFFLSIYSTIASRVSIYLGWYGEYSK